MFSVCLLTYNQEKYVEFALEGIFNQQIENFNLYISDDCSTDNTYQIIKDKVEAYAGSINISHWSNELNLGLGGNINKMLYETSWRGEYVFLAAGDDIMLSNRLSDSIRFLDKNPRVMALSTNLIYINSENTMLGLRNSTLKNQQYTKDQYLAGLDFHLNGASRVYRKDVISKYPPLQADCPTEDTTLLLRSFILGDVGLLGTPGLLYRRHIESISSKKNIIRMNEQSLLKQYLTDIEYAERKNLLSKARAVEFKKLSHQLIAERKVNRSSTNIFYRVIKRLLRNKTD